jgi:hypothetical protein
LKHSFQFLVLNIFNTVQLIYFRMIAGHPANPPGGC